MALKENQHGRSSDTTSEFLRSRSSGPVKQLHFVIHKHSGAQLHYDFRLELDGVFKSWTMAKEPSLNPEDRRLATMAQDRALRDYKRIGVNSGASRVWDQGTYETPCNDGLEQQQKAMRRGLWDGHLTFVLKGRKLKGEFALIRLKRRKQNTWLLVKKAVEHAN